MIYSGGLYDWTLGVAAGVLLTLMIEYNSILTFKTAPIFASWIVHGVGALASLVILIFFVKKSEANENKFSNAPVWYYLGGLPGAITVILSSIAINSGLTLSESIALMLVGQVIFGMLSDHFGILGIAKRKIEKMDCCAALFIVIGSLLIMIGRL
jgi:transporter family-2 protein